MITREFNKTQIYQEKFVEWLSALDDCSPEQCTLAEYIQAKSIYRLNTYQSSYLGRITANLSENLFEFCENIFGKELVTTLLATYFKHHPPRSESLTDAPVGLPETLRQQTSAPESLLFADLAEVCIQRWKILTSEDPVILLPNSDTSLNELKLIKQSSYIQPCGEHNLFSVWEASQVKQSAFKSQTFFSECIGILIAKTSPIDFIALRVPKELSALVNALIEDKTAEQALSILSESFSEESEMLTQQVNEFFNRATAMRLFTRTSRQNSNQINYPP